MAEDFQPAWLIVSAISAVSCLVFWRMPSDAGAALYQRATAAVVAPTATGTDEDEKRG
jgi:hypothetical protein